MYKISCAEKIDKEVKNYLISLGITPNKSLTLKVNFTITYSFLRELLDGDGHIGSRGRSCYWTTASKDFVKQLSDFLTSDNIKHSVYKLRKQSQTSNQIYNIRVSSKNLKYLYTKMYSSASYYLNRKKSKFII